MDLIFDWKVLKHAAILTQLLLIVSLFSFCVSLLTSFKQLSEEI